jgi:hypothetical protein
MTYYECPNEFLRRRHPGEVPSVFLAGGIVGCRDWQQDAREMLEPHGFIVLNPRRPDFPVGDTLAGSEQVAWEYRHLHRADIVLFWFSSETVQPIVMYELGRHAALSTSNIVVGADPMYPRRDDVLMQLALARPLLTVRSSLQDTCDDVLAFLDVAAA